MSVQSSSLTRFLYNVLPTGVIWPKVERVFTHQRYLKRFMCTTITTSRTAPPDWLKTKSQYFDWLVWMLSEGLKCARNSSLY